ncbi:MAG: hypothetical protein JXB88_22775 [Spirochaetales bacterium]|nr:hypothetical protein [Spirochaetales bacterium]
MKRNVVCILLIGLIGITGIMNSYCADCGDVNGNETIDIIDALLIARYYVDPEAGLEYPDISDVNNDDKIDILDALLVAQFYVGLISELECGLNPTPETTIVPGTLWISHVSGIQCEVTYYESVEDARDYLEGNGITVLETDVEHFAVVTLCGMLSGIFYKALIYEYDLEKALDLGWN